MKQELQIQKILPEDYKPKLDFFQTEEGIKLIKDSFERELAKELDLIRVSAPFFVRDGTGIQDDLDGMQKPVGFRVKHDDREIQMVHSLAKWKRYILGKFDFEKGKGLYTDMNAIRADEIVDKTHSIYTDQWDWEKVIGEEDRTLDYLKDTVRKIYKVIKSTAEIVKKKYSLEFDFPEDIHFIHSEDLEEMYPDLSSEEREREITKKYKAVFLIGIGHDLKSGKPHDQRATDYDDWSTSTIDGKKGLNGDLLFWYPIIEQAVELSSMGIRVDKEALLRQLELQREEEKKELEFHKKLLSDELPLSIGGGIGQSRLCMLLLQKAHVGEVQSSVWPKDVEKEFLKKKVPLL